MATGAGACGLLLWVAVTGLVPGCSLLGLFDEAPFAGDGDSDTGSDGDADDDVDAGPCEVQPGVVEVCDGVCTALLQPDNCGTCGHRCPAHSPRCEGGECTSCEAMGATDCGEAGCTFTELDNRNCGACKHVCPAAQLMCVDSQCISCEDFGPVWRDCGVGDCIALNADPWNCGACGLVCPETEPWCEDQVCTSCPAGLTACGPATCVDTTTDLLHCGGCGRVCAQGKECQDSTCVP